MTAVDGRQAGTADSTLSTIRARIRNSSNQPWNSRTETRQLLILVCFLLVFLVVAGRIAMIIWSSPADNGSTYKPSYWSDRVPIVDRNGITLAVNLPTDALYAHPREMTDPGKAAEGLARIFSDLDADELEERFNRQRAFLWIKRKITPEQKQAVQNIGTTGLHFGPRKSRTYPNGKLAAHLLGGTTYGGEAVSSAEVVGIAGVEQAMNEYLSNPTAEGTPLRLSIDVRLQYLIEQKLADAIRAFEAKRGTVILMNIHNGEILALASEPDFDPNDRPVFTGANAADASPLFFDPVQGVFELGSVFKVFPVAQALDEGLPDSRGQPYTQDSAVSNKSFKISGYKISGTENLGDDITLREVITRSSNAGAARIALKLGADRQREFLSRLGFLEPTSVQLAEGSLGSPLWPKRWKQLETATIAFGHGLAVSPLHLAAGYAALVNGGYRVHPTILTTDADEEKGPRVISEATSAEMVDMLRAVVTEGTASQAKSAFYAIGGKTGTANKPNPGRGYHKDKVIATFASVFPADEPRYVLIVSLNEATSNDGTRWENSAGKTAVPTALVIISEIAPMLGIRPQVAMGSGR
ncbi:MAG: penicillin-binding protein 2 [Rhodobacteraceae bacterium]|nr:penicillin-binding protein 2 [Paracoccaceae bacterium]